MRQQIERLQSKYESISLRERALVALSLIAVCWMAWDFSLGDYQRGELVELKRSVQLKQQQISRELTTHLELQQQKAGNGFQSLKAERVQLKLQLQVVQGELKAIIGRFVDPDLMPAVLEEVLAQQHGITLLQLSSLPVKPMLLDEKDRKSAVPGLYRHGMRLRVAGRYFDVLEYLAELEDSEWQFIWQELDYAVTDYPLAEVSIELETLSQKKNWMGV